MVLAVLLMLVKAFWVWGCKSLGVWGEWLEERERMERVREWIIEERRMRREKCPVVGILRAADDKGVVRKRVSFEEEERVLGNGEGRDELEGQRKGSENEKFMIEEVKCEGLVIDGGLPLRCSQESLTV